MRIDTERYRLIAEIAKTIAKTQLQIDAMNAIPTLDMTPGKRSTHDNKIETLSEFIEERNHELHCLCVEVDLAKPEPERYGEKPLTSGYGWHDLKVFRRTPKP